MVQRFPFDWKNPHGYLVAFAAEVILITCAAIAAVLATNFGLGITLILIALAKDVEADVWSIDKSAKNHPNQFQIVEQFKELLRFYSDAKQLNE